MLKVYFFESFWFIALLMYCMSLCCFIISLLSCFCDLLSYIHPLEVCYESLLKMLLFSLLLYLSICLQGCWRRLLTLPFFHRLHRLCYYNPCTAKTDRALYWTPSNHNALHTEMLTYLSSPNHFSGQNMMWNALSQRRKTESKWERKCYFTILI